MRRKLLRELGSPLRRARFSRALKISHVGGSRRGCSFERADV
jgi:hypothetical protein